MAITGDPVVLFMVGQDGVAAGADHWAQAQWAVAAPAPHMVEVDAGWSAGAPCARRTTGPLPSCAALRGCERVSFSVEVGGAI